MFCKNCGSQIDDRAVICPHCGTPTENYSNQAPAYNNSPATNLADSKSIGFAVLCFFFPVVGLILYLIWKDTYPLRARSCGKGAIIGVIVWFVLGIIYGIALASIAASYYAAVAPAVLL